MDSPSPSLSSYGASYSSLSDAESLDRILAIARSKKAELRLARARAAPGHSLSTHIESHYPPRVLQSTHTNATAIPSRQSLNMPSDIAAPNANYTNGDKPALRGPRVSFNRNVTVSVIPDLSYSSSSSFSDKTSVASDVPSRNHHSYHTSTVAMKKYHNDNNLLYNNYPSSNKLISNLGLPPRVPIVKPRTHSVSDKNNDKPADIYNRQMKWLDDREARQARQRIETSKRELKDCTFAPVLHDDIHMDCNDAADKMGCVIDAVPTEHAQKSLLSHFERQKMARDRREEEKRRMRVSTGENWTGKITTIKEFRLSSYNGKNHRYQESESHETHNVKSKKKDFSSDDIIVFDVKPKSTDLAFNHSVLVQESNIENIAVNKFGFKSNLPTASSKNEKCSIDARFVAAVREANVSTPDWTCSPRQNTEPSDNLMDSTVNDSVKRTVKEFLLASVSPESVTDTGKISANVSVQSKTSEATSVGTALTVSPLPCRALFSSDPTPPQSYIQLNMISPTTESASPACNPCDKSSDDIIRQEIHPIMENEQPLPPLDICKKLKGHSLRKGRPVPFGFQRRSSSISETINRKDSLDKEIIDPRAAQGALSTLPLVVDVEKGPFVVDLNPMHVNYNGTSNVFAALRSRQSKHYDSVNNEIQEQPVNVVDSTGSQDKNRKSSNVICRALYVCEPNLPFKPHSELHSNIFVALGRQNQNSDSVMQTSIDSNEQEETSPGSVVESVRSGDSNTWKRQSTNSPCNSISPAMPEDVNSSCPIQRHSTSSVSVSADSDSIRVMKHHHSQSLCVEQVSPVSTKLESEYLSDTDSFAILEELCAKTPSMKDALLNSNKLPTLSMNASPCFSITSMISTMKVGVTGDYFSNVVATNSMNFRHEKPIIIDTHLPSLSYYNSRMDTLSESSESTDHVNLKVVVNSSDERIVFKNDFPKECFQSSSLASSTNSMSSVPSVGETVAKNILFSPTSEYSAGYAGDMESSVTKYVHKSNHHRLNNFTSRNKTTIPSLASSSFQNYSNDQYYDSSPTRTDAMSIAANDDTVISTNLDAPVTVIGSEVWVGSLLNTPESTPLSPLVTCEHTERLPIVFTSGIETPTESPLFSSLEEESSFRTYKSQHCDNQQNILNVSRLQFTPLRHLLRRRRGNNSHSKEPSVRDDGEIEMWNSEMIEADMPDDGGLWATLESPSSHVHDLCTPLREAFKREGLKVMDTEKKPLPCGKMINHEIKKNEVHFDVGKVRYGPLKHMLLTRNKKHDKSDLLNILEEDDSDVLEWMTDSISKDVDETLSYSCLGLE